MARQVTHGWAGSVVAIPVFTAVQWSPLSVERKTPFPLAAYRMEGVRGSRTRAMISPLSIIVVQMLPLSVERKTPFNVPAYNVEGVTGLIARQRMFSLGPRPSLPMVSQVFTAVHVSPLSAERKMPLPYVPAYRVEGVTGSMTRAVTGELVVAKLVFNAVHVPPLSVERKTWLPVPAYRVEGVLGLMARTETGPPYSGTCIQVSVSAACTAGARTSALERLRARHETRINMVDGHMSHF